MTQYRLLGPHPGPLAGQFGEVLSLAQSPRGLPLISLGRGSATPLSEDPELTWTAPTSHPGGPRLLQEEKGLDWGSTELVSS